MKTKGLFWGCFFVVFGLLFLGRNMGWLTIDWDYLKDFWPLLLILAGVNLILERRNSQLVIITTLLLGIIAPVALFSFLNRDSDFGRYEYHLGDDKYDDDEDDREAEEDENDTFRSDVGKVQENVFVESMSADTREAKLKFEGGAGHFVIGETSTDLIKAETKQTFGVYKMEVERDPTTRTPTIVLTPNEGNVKIKDGELKNKVDIRLNPNPVWDIDIDMGAGEGDFDLSAFQVRQVSVDAGAADVDLKLGDKAAQTDVKVSAGVASVVIRVPAQVGCRIEKDGALNINELEDFQNTGNGVYLSPEYDKATKKINIRFDGGISRFKVERY